MATEAVAEAEAAAEAAPQDLSVGPGPEEVAEAEEERLEIFLKDYRPPHYAFDKVQYSTNALCSIGTRYPLATMRSRWTLNGMCALL